MADEGDGGQAELFDGGLGVGDIGLAGVGAADGLSAAAVAALVEGDRAIARGEPAGGLRPVRGAAQQAVQEQHPAAGSLSSAPTAAPAVTGTAARTPDRRAAADRAAVPAAGRLRRFGELPGGKPHSAASGHFDTPHHEPWHPLVSPEQLHLMELPFE